MLTSQPKQTIRQTVTQLMQNPVRSQARKKGIITLSKRKNITRADAQFQQAIKIAQSQYRK